jgi:hypothetical protein
MAAAAAAASSYRLVMDLRSAAATTMIQGCGGTDTSSGPLSGGRRLRATEAAQHESTTLRM